MAYNRRWLDEQGAKYLLALILHKLDALDEPFVTYGEAAKFLERELDIPTIFSLHIGSVAGKMMDKILSVDGAAPPINALVTRASGIPGDGFAHYYRHVPNQGEGGWLDLSIDRKVEVVQIVREAVRRYARWDEVFDQAFGDRPAARNGKNYTELDGKPPEVKLTRGNRESEEHRRLKEWARDNPKLLGLAGFEGETEKLILSGDRLDVFFRNGTDFAVVEAKSIRSSDDDLQRGLYQCVKYRAVLQATELPVEADVRAILVTERKLPPELESRAKVLGIIVRVQKVNSR